MAVFGRRDRRRARKDPASGCREQRCPRCAVKFPPGNDNAGVEARVTGEEYRDCVLGARVGQTTGVSLVTEGTACFNILSPGSENVAIYNGSMDGPDAAANCRATGRIPCESFDG